MPFYCHMAKSMHEVFLDEVILQYLDLEMLRMHPEESRAAAFLNELGYPQKLSHIQDILEQQAIARAMPSGIFYVITPYEGFIYKKDGNSINQLEGSDRIDYRDGSLKDVIRTIKESHSNHLKNSIAINVIFYNKQAVEAFTKMMEVQGFHHLTQIELKNLDSAREIRYYVYLN